MCNLIKDMRILRGDMIISLLSLYLNCNNEGGIICMVCEWRTSSFSLIIEKNALSSIYFSRPEVHTGCVGDDSNIFHPLSCPVVPLDPCWQCQCKLLFRRNHHICSSSGIC